MEFTASFKEEIARRQYVTPKVLEAALCVSGRLANIDSQFDEQTLETAHARYPRGIALAQLFATMASINGFRHDYSPTVTLEMQQAAFDMHAGASTSSLSTILSNVANKFLRQSFNAQDLTCLKIAKIRPVRDFKTATTVSLVGDTKFKKVGPDGEIKHGTLGEETYSNKADTYARMLAITRTDLINDDLGALTDAPKKLGRGAAQSLNEIFWTKFLDNANFFKAGNNNVSTDDGTLGVAGLSQADTIFKAQTDPDGNPLGISPKILLVPTALQTTALNLMTSEKIKGSSDEPDANPFRGRYRVESSPYMQNNLYTGYSDVAWYLLADPEDMPVIEIAALNGRVEPFIESADAKFDVLGVQMRGYADVGVELQEYRGGVRADGSAAD